MNSIVNSFFQDPFMNGQGRRNNFDPFAQHNSLMARQQQNMHDPFAMMNQMMGSHMNTFGGGFPNMMVEILRFFGWFIITQIKSKFF